MSGMPGLPRVYEGPYFLCMQHSPLLFGQPCFLLVTRTSSLQVSACAVVSPGGCRALSISPEAVPNTWVMTRDASSCTGLNFRMLELHLFCLPLISAASTASDLEAFCAPSEVAKHPAEAVIQ